MKKTKICSCPKCGNDVYESLYSYNCECGFKCGKEIWGAEISIDDVKKICEGKETDFYDFKKEEKEWTAKLVYSKEEGRVIFKFKDRTPQKVVGKCPICGEDVKETKDFYLCSNYKKTCNLIVGKDIKGHKLTKEELEKLLNKETVSNLTFTWKNGNTGNANIKLDENGKVSFLFDK